ncbi:MAG: hypothetical protein WBA74_07305, partial [Cyclobacteriaceae bacterium]
MEKKLIDKNDLKGIWFRRASPVKLSKAVEKENLAYLTMEFQTFLESVKLLLEDDFRVLGSHQNGILNKVRVLNAARKCGLTIPDYVMSNNKDLIIQFIGSIEDKVIIKAISDTHTFKRKGNVYTSYTNEVSLKDIEESNFAEFPIFCQRQIDKDFEIRSFYLNGNFYSMAIFSQMDQSALIDFRSSHENKRIRKVPFQLSKKIEVQLTNLMRKIGLNTGSIDLIHSKCGTTYFLEVNPAGQIGMTSFPCN